MPRRDRTNVVAVKTTRYYIYGKGYNSRLAAYMQVAKRFVGRQAWRYVHSMECKPSARDSLRDWDYWYSEYFSVRYPKQEGCKCLYCSWNHGNAKRDYASRTACCFVLKLADYRRIAREIMLGVRDDEGNIIYALPARSEVDAA